MKRVILFALVLMLCAGALADTGIDWTQYPDDELQSTYDDLKEMLREVENEISSRTEADDQKPYHVDGVDFEIRFYSYNDNSILLEYDWVNTSSVTTSFLRSISSQAFQDGQELSDWILHFGEIKQNDNDKIAPGFGKTSYQYYRLNNDSEITILITDHYNPGNFEKGLVFKVMPDELKAFQPESE